MAESLKADIFEKFDVKGADVRTYSPLALAYIGDSVFDVIVRSILVGKGNAPVNKLHRSASAVVNARVQADMVESIMEELSEEEVAVFKRGRNSKPHTKAKNASTGEYLEATGFEALLGYLYLKDDMERVYELVSMAFDRCDITIS